MESMSGSVPLRSATSEAILREIRADIITRKLKPGQKLTEQSVCEKYGISRSPVRTIFQQLEKEGMVIMLGNGCKQIVPFERSDPVSYTHLHAVSLGKRGGLFPVRNELFAPLPVKDLEKIIRPRAGDPVGVFRALAVTGAAGEADHRVDAELFGKQYGIFEIGVIRRGGFCVGMQDVYKRQVVGCGVRKARRERELRLWRQHDIAYVNACAETVRAAILVVGVSHLIDRSRKYRCV